MNYIKIYQICHDLIVYFAILTSPKKNQLGLIFRTGDSILQVVFYIEILERVGLTHNTKVMLMLLTHDQLDQSTYTLDSGA